MFIRPRPKVLSDVFDKKSKIGPFTPLKKRLNLNYQEKRKLPVKSLVWIISGLLIVNFFLSPVNAPIRHSTQAQTNQSEKEERAALETQLGELEEQIAEYEATIENYRRQGASLESEINRLNAQIAKINLQIKSVNLSLSKLDREIEDTEGQIEQTESEIKSSKATIAEALQSIYRIESQSMIEVLLQNPRLSDFFGNVNDLLTVQNNLRVSLEHLTSLRNELINEKEELGLERADAAALKAYQDSQKRTVETTKVSKNSLLKVTKGEESKYRELLEETEKTAAQIRSRIFELLGGGQLTFEQAYELALMAEKATGIRAALLLAVLDRESSLGQNVGRCQYNVNPYYPNRASNPTTMHPTRDVPIFLEITKKLGLNPDTTLVSCPIPQDGAYGGAMGPAQFIPSTWQLYEQDIERITGSKPASPWRNADAFVGTALYLKDAYESNSCIEYSNQIPNQKQTLRERCAAAKYYAGGRWYRYRWVYGEPVVERANRFQRDIDILTRT